MNNTDDTNRTDVLDMILKELKEMREENKSRIKSIERELELVRYEQQRHGVKLASMEEQCRRVRDPCNECTNAIIEDK